MTASVLKQDPNTKRFKWTLIYFNTDTQYANFPANPLYNLNKYKWMNTSPSLNSFKEWQMDILKYEQSKGMTDGLLEVRTVSMNEDWTSWGMNSCQKIISGCLEVWKIVKEWWMDILKYEQFSKNDKWASQNMTVSKNDTDWHFEVCTFSKNNKWTASRMNNFKDWQMDILKNEWFQRMMKRHLEVWLWTVSVVILSAVSEFQQWWYEGNPKVSVMTIWGQSQSFSDDDMKALPKFQWWWYEGGPRVSVMTIWGQSQSFSDDDMRAVPEFQWWRYGGTAKVSVVVIWGQSQSFSDDDMRAVPKLSLIHIWRCRRTG